MGLATDGCSFVALARRVVLLLRKALHDGAEGILANLGLNEEAAE